MLPRREGISESGKLPEEWFSLHTIQLGLQKSCSCSQLMCFPEAKVFQEGQQGIRESGILPEKWSDTAQLVL